jgi:hypothetical protein
MCVGRKKHQYAAFYVLVESMNKFAKIFVALVKILIVKIELELVTLIVSTHYRCKYLTLTDKMLTHKLHSEL